MECIPFYPDEHEGKMVVEKPEDALLTPADRWILSAVNTLAKDVTENMDKFGSLESQGPKVYDFIWDEFCDWYVELAKYRISHAEEIRLQQTVFYGY